MTESNTSSASQTINVNSSITSASSPISARQYPNTKFNVFDNWPNCREQIVHFMALWIVSVTFVIHIVIACK